MRLKKLKDRVLGITVKDKLALEQKLKDPVMMVRLRRMQAHRRGNAVRARNSLSVLDRLKHCNLRATLVYCHGSGGCSWDNMRIGRMVAGMGILVIAPDDFAYPKNTAMGQLRHKDVQPLHKFGDNVDYWENDLIYASDATGQACYSTKAEKVLEKPDEYRELYEKCYQLRRSELHFTLQNMPLWIKTKGIY